MKSFYVTKATGEKERFDVSKLKRSMSNAGASHSAIKKVISALQPHFRDGITTKEIYSKAYSLLKNYSEPSAGRYKLKEAIMELGPSGFPFERFIGELLTRLGYRTEVSCILNGKCVDHEIDVIGENSSEHFMVECKFHNRQDHHCTVSVTLYIQARFLDLKSIWQDDPSLQTKNFSAWIVTNTRFTSEATRYAECTGMRLLSWSYPEGNALKDLIGKVKLHPVTCLSNLTRRESRELLKNDIVFCKQLLDRPGILDQLRFNHVKKDLILTEASSICNHELPDPD